MITTTATECGRVDGVAARLPGVTAFKGVPYGATTAGQRRWRPPQPPLAWAGVRHAAAFGPAAPQPGDTGSVPQSEDCLNLNVWTGAASEAERRPVLVWIHGGRFLFGHGGEPTYDGSVLAAKGLVVVTVNFRLGVFGYLATPELSAESGHAASGNYGLLDAIAALHWVRRNIAAFGGDPDRVTVAGQSSGGASVLDLVYSPMTKDLFRAAIVHSAALYPKDPTISTLAPSHRLLSEAEVDGVRFGAERGATTLAQLRALPTETLLTGSNANDQRLPGNPPPPLFRPVIDGWVLPRNYWETLTAGAQHDVAVLTGHTHDEGGIRPNQTLTVAAYEDWARNKYGDLAEEFLGIYPAGTDVEAADQRNAALRESAQVSAHLWATEFRRSTTRPVFTYFWTHVPPTPEGAARGSFHGSELPYVFGTAEGTEEQLIGEQVTDFVANFVRANDPNGAAVPRWEPFGPDAFSTFRIGATCAPLDLPDPVRAGFFRRYFDTQKPW